MPTSLSRTETSAHKNVPILYLDTCAILDILRDPIQEDVRIHEQEASLALLQVAESGINLHALVADQVCTEFQDIVQDVEKKAKDGLLKFQNQIDEMDKLVTLHGSSGQVDLRHWKDYVVRCRDIADRWLNVATLLSQSNQIKLKAVQRVSQARTPSRKGKECLKDCIIVETYLEHISKLCKNGLTSTAVFVSSNTKDYTESRGTVLRKDLEKEFKPLRLKYAPNMAAAKYFLGL